MLLSMLVIYITVSYEYCQKMTMLRDMLEPAPVSTIAVVSIVSSRWQHKSVQVVIALSAAS
jgi:hypothetical protein